MSFMIFKAFEQSRKDKEWEKISRKLDEDIAKTKKEIEDMLKSMNLWT
jgi:hypothetical protein